MHLFVINKFYPIQPIIEQVNLNQLENFKDFFSIMTYLTIRIQMIEN